MIALSKFKEKGKKGKGRFERGIGKYQDKGQ